MKTAVILFSLILTFCFAGLAVQAQETRLDSSPAVFRTFFSKFLGAVHRNDKVAVASMSSFPFRYGFDAGDEGTMTRKQFIQRFADIFGRSPKEFLVEKNPLFSRDDTSKYIISTEDAAHLVFTRKGGSFRFSSFIVEP